MLTASSYLLMYGAGVFGALFVSGAWGFYLYQVNYFLYPESRWWGAMLPSISYSFVSVAVMGTAWLLQRGRLAPAPLTLAPQFKWLVAIALLLSLASLTAIVPGRHAASVTEFWKLLVVFALAYKLLDTERKLELSLLAYICGAFYIGWEAYVSGRNSMGRVEGIGMVDVPDANGFSAALVPAIPLLVFFFWQGSRWQRILVCALGIWIANGIVLINSRGSFLGAAVGTIWFLGTMLLARKRHERQRLAAVFMIVASLGAAVYVTDDLFWERMGTLSEVEDESKSGSHRYRMWLSAIDLARDHPLGVGAFGFQELSPRYVAPELFFRKQTRKAVHSTWFQALSEIGWLGLAAFVAACASCFRSSRAIKRELVSNDDAQRLYFRTVALEGAFIAYLVAGSFIDVFRSQMLYWLILFFAVQHKLHAGAGAVEPVPTGARLGATR